MAQSRVDDGPEANPRRSAQLRALVCAHPLCSMRTMSQPLETPPEREVIPALAPSSQDAPPAVPQTTPLEAPGPPPVTGTPGDPRTEASGAAAKGTTSQPRDTTPVAPPAATPEEDPRDTRPTVATQCYETRVPASYLEAASRV